MAIILYIINKYTDLETASNCDMGESGLEVVSLFSGAGGMDYGFIRAGHEIIYAIDNNQDACYTYRKNIGIDPVCKDIKKVNSFPKGDIVVACCPCQGFSLFGTRKYYDQRNFLYKEIIRCLENTKPKYFIIENVKGLLSLYKQNFFKMINEELRKVGYKIIYDVLDAKNFGAPQDRLRVFIIGIRKDLTITYEFPEKTHGPDKLDFITIKQHSNEKVDHVECKMNGSIKNYITLKQAIGHLKPPNVTDYWNSKDYSFFYMSRNRRRNWDQVSYTIQASGRHEPLHPSSPPMKRLGKDKWIFTNDIKNYRRLSVKECSIIQTFPESYEFVGNITSKYRQIGNAVPPIVSYNLAKKFLDIENQYYGNCTKQKDVIFNIGNNKIQKGYSHIV